MSLMPITYHNSYMNKYQFDAVKAGDWLCINCPTNDRGKNPGCYWYDYELEIYDKDQCDKIYRI